MGNKCGKKAAVRQKELEEEERMRNLEEKAKKELEEREREDKRRFEIERLLREEQEAKDRELKLKQAREMELEKSIKDQEEEARRLDGEEALRLASMESAVKSAKSSSREFKSQRSGSSTIADSEASSNSYGAVDMRTFTPFDMSKIDQTAKYMATRCGCTLADSHNPIKCPICQGIDLSDAPLIA